MSQLHQFGSVFEPSRIIASEFTEASLSVIADLGPTAHLSQAETDALFGFARFLLTPRFFKKVRLDYSTGCWIWVGAKCGLPGYLYGQIRVGDGNESKMSAHRLAYLRVRGPIPLGLEPDHLCEIKLCVNPWHLELVTHRENAWRRNHRGEEYLNLRKIRSLYRSGLDLKLIAAQTGIRYLYVWRAINGRTKQRKVSAAQERLAL